jgi:hypothetical protein
MNWHDILNAMQNRMQWRGLIYKAEGEQETTNRKRLRDSKTQYLLLRKSNRTTTGRLRPKEITTVLLLLYEPWFQTYMSISLHWQGNKYVCIGSAGRNSVTFSVFRAKLRHPQTFS